MNEESQSSDQATKVCSECNKIGTKDEFAKKQWKKSNPKCRICAEYTKISQDKSRVCSRCQVDQPRFDFSIHQWGKMDKAMCHTCCDTVSNECLQNMGTNSAVKELPDGTSVCDAHSLESCDVCMMDFTLPNKFAIKKNELGRNLTQSEYDEVAEESYKAMGIYINHKMCIMDGLPECPRSGKKMRCPCHEVTYCSKTCQKYHWPIHKITCKDYEEKQRKKAARKK